MPRKTILQEVDAALEQIEEARIEASVRLLTPLVRREFERVRKLNPKLKRIIFGNGTYLLDGIQDLIRQDYSRASISNDLYVTYRGPKYLERLYELCERIRGLRVEDVE